MAQGNPAVRADGSVGNRAKNQKPRPGDMTGSLKYAGERQKEEDQERATAEQLLQAQQEQAVRRTTVVDMTKAAFREQVDAAQAVQEAEVDMAPREHVIRVVADIEDMVFGKDVEVVVNDEFPDQSFINDRGLRKMSFEEGTEYRVDHDVYLHLKELGYLWD